jgi:hypothetical protein
MNLLAPKPSKFFVGLLAFVFLQGCQSSIKVFKSPPEQPKAKAKHSHGFFYRLPKVGYSLQIHGHHISKKRGELQDFSHLLKMPLDKGVQAEAIIIDSLNMVAKAYPDATKQYFVSVGKRQADVKALLNGLPTEPEPRKKNIPISLMQSAPRVSIGKSQPSEQQKETNNKFDQQVSFQQNITKLLNLHDQLLGAVQGLSSDTTFQSDSVLRIEVQQIRKTLEQYQGRIQQLRTLFNTFEDRDLGKRAQELSGIVHKIVELKTALAGGQQDINYSQTSLAAMLKSLDSMIKVYQKPFKPQNLEKPVRWGAHFTPEPDKKQFQFGLRQSGNSDQYYIAPYDPQSTYQARLKVTIKPQKNGTTEAFHKAWQQQKNEESSSKGLFYNISAPAKITIEFIHDQERQVLGSTTVSIPQLGDVSHLPPNHHFEAVKIDPFYGSLTLGL